MVYASLDIGGTNTVCALATPEGEIIAERTIPTRSYDGAARVLERIAEAVRELGEAPAAVGAGVPGLLDLVTGRSLFLPNFKGNWRDIPVAGSLSSYLDCPVYLLNDVRCATLGELTFGLGREGVKDMAFFAIGTGIGGGIVLDGKLRLGRFGAAGEIGHQTIQPDGPMCGCGSRGCLETLASGPALSAEGVRLMRSGLAPILYDIAKGDPGSITPREMQAAAEAGDDAVRIAIHRAATFLGIGVANVITTLHPELIVLGGGVAAIGQPLIDRVKTVIGQRVRMFPPDDVRVERSLLGDKAGLYGGIALARNGGVC